MLGTPDLPFYHLYQECTPGLLRFNDCSDLTTLLMRTLYRLHERKVGQKGPNRKPSYWIAPFFAGRLIPRGVALLFPALSFPLILQVCYHLTRYCQFDWSGKLEVSLSFLRFPLLYGFTSATSTLGRRLNTFTHLFPSKRKVPYCKVPFCAFSGLISRKCGVSRVS